MNAKGNRFLTFIAIFLTFNLLFPTLALGALPLEGRKEPPIQAKAALLMEVDSGRIFWGKDFHKSLPQASTTKITTAILALERGKLNDIVTISPKAAETGESSIWLEEGENLTLEELLWALMLYSANDSAVAIAEHIAGSEEEFIGLMNKEVKKMGALKTHYNNPHGLDGPEHFSTAYDLAMITRYGFLNTEEFKDIVQFKEKKVSWENSEWDRVVHNRNRLLDLYPGADGVKTGYTSKAGRCLVASATREDMQLIAVVLNSPDIFEESALLLDYGFENIDKKQLVGEGQNYGTLKVQKGLKPEVAYKATESFSYPITSEDQTKVEIALEDTLWEAPLEEGQKVGVLKVYVNKEEVGEVTLELAEGVKRKSNWQIFKDQILSWWKRLWG